ncbi:hypothetical protein [Lacibacter sp. H407]|uniref:hypothetical protein n=1 Tax=Lacibacter sp. H407 TaxID=3133423 RepID=UPI0030C5739A
MKISKLIFYFSIIAVTLFYSEASTTDQIRKVGLISASAENQASVIVKNKAASFNQALPKERVSLETSTQTTVTPRIEERNFLNGLFHSFSSFNRTVSIDHLTDTFQLAFVPHALKIIYPHHYFW